LEDGWIGLIFPNLEIKGGRIVYTDKEYEVEYCKYPPTNEKFYYGFGSTSFPSVNHINYTNIFKFVFAIVYIIFICAIGYLTLSYNYNLFLWKSRFPKETLS